MPNNKDTRESVQQLARKKHHWDEILEQTQIIPAVRNAENLAAALASPIKIVYLLFGNPMTIPDMLKTVQDCGKLPLVNADLLQGFSRDAFAVEYLAHCGTAGIISTNHETLKAARDQEAHHRPAKLHDRFGFGGVRPPLPAPLSARCRRVAARHRSPPRFGSHP